MSLLRRNDSNAAVLRTGKAQGIKEELVTAMGHGDGSRRWVGQWIRYLFFSACIFESSRENCTMDGSVMSCVEGMITIRCDDGDVTIDVARALKIPLIADILADVTDDAGSRVIPVDSSVDEFYDAIAFRGVFKESQRGGLRYWQVIDRKAESIEEARTRAEKQTENAVLTARKHALSSEVFLNEVNEDSRCALCGVTVYTGFDDSAECYMSYPFCEDHLCPEVRCMRVDGHLGDCVGWL